MPAALASSVRVAAAAVAVVAAAAELTAALAVVAAREATADEAAAADEAGARRSMAARRTLANSCSEPHAAARVAADSSASVVRIVAERVWGLAREREDGAGSASPLLPSATVPSAAGALKPRLAAPPRLFAPKGCTRAGA